VTSRASGYGLSVVLREREREDPRVEIEIFADVWCPFAHFSLRTVRAFRDRLSPESTIFVRAWPLELVNGKPLDPVATAAHVAELRRDVAPELFSGFDPEAMPTSTLSALALVEAAYDADPRLGEGLSVELRDALFEEGRRIDDDMLARLARRSGLDVTAIGDTGKVESRLRQGRTRGVRGSPHIFIGDSGMFCPLLDMERSRVGEVHMKERFERFEAFVREQLVS
jgi:predicted DsbA family dithiol-disulfide isomerase